MTILDNGVQSRGAFEKIKRTIRDSRKPVYYWILNPVLAAAFMVASIAFAANKGKTKADETLTHVLLVLSPFGASLCWLFYTIYYQNNKSSIIIPKYRADAPNFWKRNSDQIVLGTIMTAIGAILGSLGNITPQALFC